MTITLKTLEFDNMFSYGENNILDFTESPITQLNAINGSGKTSLALIIQELLYSKNVKSIKKTDIKNKFIEDNSWKGAITFIKDDKEYKVVVNRKGATSKVFLYEDGIDISEHKVPDTYKKIKEDILGMDFEIFAQLTYQSSIDLLQFIKATDANRKKFLINLFNLHKYIQIGDTIKIKSNEADKELTLKEGELNGVNNFLDETTIPETKEVIPVPSIDSTLSERKGVLQEQLAGHEVLCKKIDKNNLYKEEQTELVFNISMKSIDENELEQLNKQYSEMNTTFRTNNQRISEWEKEISKLDLSDTCSMCGQPIDNAISMSILEELNNKISKTKDQNSKLRNDVKKVKDNLAKLQQDKKAFEDNQKNILRFEQLSQLIDNDLSSKYPDADKIKNEIKELTDEINQQTKKHNDAVSYNQEVNNHNTKVEALIDQKEEFISRQTLLNNDIIKLRAKVNNLEILRKAFSTSGIVAFKLENLTKELEDTINNYLAELSDGQFQVVFRLDKEKLNVIIRNNGLEVSTESLSGGEFGRVQTAILLAIRSVLAKIGGNTINTLFLDEVDGVLDSAGKEKLIEVLQEERNLNVFPYFS